MNTDIARWHPGTPNAAVGHSDQCNYHPTLYVAARPQVGMIPINHKAADYEFKCIFRIHTEEAINRDD